MLSVRYSFFRWNGIGPMTWVGLENYADIVTIPDLMGTIVNAFKLIVFFSFIPVAVGLIVAAVMHRVARGRFGAVARTVLFLPQVIPLVAAGIIWGWLLSRTGLINQILNGIGLKFVTRAWLGDFDWALARRRYHRYLGSARVVHRAAADRHDQDRDRPLRVRTDRRRGVVP